MPPRETLSCRREPFIAGDYRPARCVILPSMNRASKVALITGGAKRVGRAIALQLAQEGFDIAFTYLSSESEAHALLEELRAIGRTAHAIRADLSQPAIAVEEIHRAISVEFGRLDVLVNNASLYLPADLAATTSTLVHQLNAILV